MNLYEAGVSPDGSLALGSQRLDLSSLGAGSGLASYQGRKVIVGIRPEDLALGRGTLTADVRLVEMLGDEQQVYFSIDATPATGGASGQGEGLLATGTPNGVARVGSRVPIKPGDRVTFAVDVTRLHFFDPDSGVAIA
jgi:multiple sugar transport system ATP-binding protein